MTAPNGTVFRRLKFRDGYSVEWFGTVYGYVLRAGDSSWFVEPLDGPVVYARYRSRGDAARDMLERAGIRA